MKPGRSGVHVAVLAGLGLVLAVSCGSPRSLLRVYLDGEREFKNVSLSLRATGIAAEAEVMADYPAMDVPIHGADPLKIGFFLPSSMHGMVTVHFSARDGGCEVGVGDATASNVDSGQSINVFVTLKAVDCISTGDAGAGGTGGATGTGGAPGTGGAQGTGGVAGTGGTPGTGGAPGTGGVPGSGGAAVDAPVDVAPDAVPDVAPDLPVDLPRETPCEPETTARTCGKRCNIDVPNNCGTVVHCGACGSASEMCGGPAQPNVCVPCQDTTRVCRNLECGVVTDACGNRVSCGTCGLRLVCCNGACVQPFRCQIFPQ